MAKKMKWLDKLAIALLIIGGLNWGLVALFKFDLVTWVTFGMNWLDTTLKVLVGASAIYSVFSLFKK